MLTLLCCTLADRSGRVSDHCVFHPRGSYTKAYFVSPPDPQAAPSNNPINGPTGSEIGFAPSVNGAGQRQLTLPSSSQRQAVPFSGASADGMLRPASSRGHDLGSIALAGMTRPSGNYAMLNADLRSSMGASYDYSTQYFFNTSTGRWELVGQIMGQGSNPQPFGLINMGHNGTGYPTPAEANPGGMTSYVAPQTPDPTPRLDEPGPSNTGP